jgi:serine/threonine protein kinase
MHPSNPSEEEIFAKALELSGADREAYLAKATAGNASLREQVESLIKASGEAGTFLNAPVTLPETVALSEKPGDKIGRYKLREKIGEGGCGVVYVAEQEEPVRRRVALKIIKLGMDTRQVVARFEAERQALALMDHPNIAKVLDAGATDTGRPYFVMELVRGIKITDYCDQNNLTTEERLKLFIQACSAIQHAHQKGIIHRDIKPSNILVTLHDGVPVPKVIDFGIAKATSDQRLTDKTVYTAFEQFIGTPAYMSPEQAEMSGLDIDTRSDIYSLGVLLYELLTGQTPFDAKTLLQAGLDKMRKMIREEEPPRPSTRLSTLKNASLATVANHRRAEPPRLITLLRGDLDWIAMKALEKDRTRRYETVNGLASDVGRHLQSEPVLARPPSFLYRTHKMILRNRLAVASFVSLFILVAATITISISLVRKEQAAHNRALLAEEERNKLQFEASARSTAAQAQNLFEQNRNAEAEPLYREILAIRRKQHGNAHLDVASAIDELWEVIDWGDECNALAREALTIRTKLLGEQHPDVAASMSKLAEGLINSKELAEAEVLLRKSLAIRKNQANGGNDLTSAIQRLAEFLAQQKRYFEAESLYRENLELNRKWKLEGFGSDVPDALNRLAGLMQQQGNLVEAEILLREIVTLRKEAGGNTDLSVAEALRQLSGILRKIGKSNEADKVRVEAVNIEKWHMIDGNPGFVYPYLTETPVNLANNNQYEEAENIFSEVLLFTNQFTLSMRDRIIVRADFYADTANWEKAAADLRDAIQMSPDDHWEWYRLTPLLVKIGDYTGYQRHCQAMLERFGNSTNAVVQRRTSKACLLTLDNRDEFARASKIAYTNTGEDKDHSWRQLAKALASYRQNQFAQAIEWAGQGRTNDVWSSHTREFSDAILAMARHKLGNTNISQAKLNESIENDTALMEAFTPGNYRSHDHWHDPLFAHILIREARHLIQGRASLSE